MSNKDIIEEKSIENYLILNDDNKGILKIPTENLFDLFSPYAIDRLVNHDSTDEIEHELNQLGMEKRKRQGRITEDGYLILEWKEAFQDKLKQYKKEYPAPIPTIYEVPIHILQSLLHTSEYRVTIEVQNNKLVMRKAIAGVFQSDSLTISDLENAVMDATGAVIEFVRVVNRACIFKVVM